MTENRRALLSSATMLAVLGACVGGPNVDPQEPPPPLPREAAPAAVPDTPGAAAQGRAPAIEYDEILAIVGSDVVTKSSIRDRLTSALEEAEREWQKTHPGKRLPSNRALDIEASIVQQRVQDILLADHVDRLGHDPKRVKLVVDRLVNDELEKAREDAGSDQELRERLRRRGMSVDEYRSTLRDKIKRQLAMGEELRRIGIGSELLATPGQMRAFYDENRKTFTTEAEVDLVTLRFDLETKAGGTPESHAKSAAERLRGGDEPAQIAAALGAMVKQLPGTRPGSGLQEFLKDFAFAKDRKEGDVSEPVRVNEQLWVLQATRVVAAGVRPFASREVQEEIRNRIFEVRRDELLERIREEEQRRIRVRSSYRYGGDIGRKAR